MYMQKKDKYFKALITCHQMRGRLGKSVNKANSGRVVGQWKLIVVTMRIQWCYNAARIIRPAGEVKTWRLALRLSSGWLLCATTTTWYPESKSTPLMFLEEADWRAIARCHPPTPASCFCRANQGNTYTTRINPNPASCFCRTNQGNTYTNHINPTPASCFCRKNQGNSDTDHIPWLFVSAGKKPRQSWY